MTTALPTGDSLPAWLPDEATLSRLAGELLRALPGLPLDPARIDPAPSGLPAAEPPPPAPTKGMSPPSGPPPTSAPASYAVAVGSAAPTPELPMLPITPDLPGLSTPAPGVASAVGPYYFLDDAPGYTPAALADPGFGQPEMPSPPLVTSPAAPGAPDSTPPPRYYYLAEPDRSPGLPLDPHPAFDVRAVRRDFPILSEQVNGRPGDGRLRRRPAHRRPLPRGRLARRDRFRPGYY
jgi:cysteine desulfurase/selenocysteine lyase